MPIPAILGTVIKAAAPALIGGLFRKKQKQQKTSNTIDYQSMVRSAQAAGINPLTALRNGGAAGFQQTHHPVLADRSFVADAMQSGLQAAFAFDPRDAQREEIEHNILKAQLQRINSQNQYWDGMLNPISSVGKSVVHSTEQNSFVQKDNSVPLQGVRPTIPKVREPHITNPYPKFTNYEANPWFPNAEAWEDRHGDIAGGAIAFAVNTPADALWNLNLMGKKALKEDKENIRALKHWLENKGRSLARLPKINYGETWRNGRWVKNYSPN